MTVKLNNSFHLIIHYKEEIKEDNFKPVLINVQKQIYAVLIKILFCIRSSVAPLDQ